MQPLRKGLKCSFYFIVPCTHRKDCSAENWGSWRGYVTSQKPGCYEQTRSRPFKHPLQTTHSRMGCEGLIDICGSPSTQRRRRCMLIRFMIIYSGIPISWTSDFSTWTSRELVPGARFSKAPESFRARKAIFRSSVFKNGEVYTPETYCINGTSLRL